MAGLTLWSWASIVVAFIAVAVALYYAVPPLLAKLIRRGFGGYEHQINDVDESLPLRPCKQRSVLVVGGGLAGISAATHLAERGFEVTLREKANHLGGKIGAWNETIDGQELEVEHGFHAFFRHYYNLNRFLDKTGVRKNLVPIDDYLILGSSGERWQFRGLATAPILNLVALWRRGMYRMRDIVLGPALHEMDAFLAYDEDATFTALDDTSYQAFADQAELPPELRLVFNTFARAFFAEDDRMSMAELVKSFHFFYLSHDHGLLYDYPNGDYQQTVIAPIRRHLERHGVRVELGRGVGAVAPERGGVEVDGERFDHVVLATSSVAARRIAMHSPKLAQRAPKLAKSLLALRPSQRYAVMRIWIDRPIRTDVPVFLATERRRVLDAVTAYHRITEQAEAWAQGHDGSVIELHCYAVPDDIAGDDEVGRLLFDELLTYFPELEGARIVHEHLQVNANFTAFHVGMHSERPTTSTDVEGVYLAGDWVKTPLPAMLMEAAFSSGLLAANAVLAAESLQQNPVYSVPQRGILADLKARARRADRPQPVGPLRPRQSA